ncbi:valacyclovir hydrolase-like [Sebastes umbrosus]|uniref:valacyclovir hydrolase-like n=1 Tax=Sebastes umbrosus TaxID=72105 RepID=UPI00189D4E00|nr:valacyclovir hydrolase-like [Sebastes umbrosus]
MALFLLGGRFFKCRTDIKRVITATQPYCSSVVSGRQHVNGVDLYYERTGRGKHAVLLVPGAMGCPGIHFEHQMKSLNKERFTLVGLDPRGYGQSRPPARDLPPDFYEIDAKDGVDLMKALGFSKFSVMGWSAGGTVALIAAAKNPDLIKQLVVWGAKAFITEVDVKIHNETRDVSTARWEKIGPMTEMYGEKAFAKGWSDLLDAYSQFPNRPGGSICLELLPLISCPTLIVHGERDRIAPFFHSQLQHEHIKGSRLHIIPNGGHALHDDYPDEFNKLVEDFLED